MKTKNRYEELRKRIRELLNERHNDEEAYCAVLTLRYSYIIPKPLFWIGEEVVPNDQYENRFVVGYRFWSHETQTWYYGDVDETGTEYNQDELTSVGGDE